MFLVTSEISDKCRRLVPCHVTCPLIVMVVIVGHMCKRKVLPTPNLEVHVAPTQVKSVNKGRCCVISEFILHLNNIRQG